MNPSSERDRLAFEAWKKRDNPRYQPTDDGKQDRRDWEVWCAALSTQPSPIEEERRHFEADAAPYGFDLTRDNNTTGEPWCDYRDHDTGHRWAGWLASREPHHVPSTQPPQAGWKMVPVEPTQDMLTVGEAEFRSYCLRHMFGHPAVWAAMLAAAPLPPVPGQEGGE